jgi:WD40 repeat protein
VTGDNKQTRIRDAESGALLRALADGCRARQVRFGPEPYRVLINEWGRAGVWGLRSGERLCLIQEPSVALDFVDWDREVTRVAACSDRGEVFVFDAANGQRLVRLEHPKVQLRQSILSADGKVPVTIGCEKVAWVWDAGSGTLRTALEGHKETTTYAAFSPDGKWLGTASEDYTVRLWSVSAMKALTLH